MVNKNMKRNSPSLNIRDANLNHNGLVDWQKLKSSPISTIDKIEEKPVFGVQVAIGVL